MKTTTLIMPVVFFYFKPRTVPAIGTHQPEGLNQSRDRPLSRDFCVGSG